MRDRIYIATFSENAAEVSRQYGFGLELNDFCISENLDPERLEESLEAARRQLRTAETNRAVFHGPFTEIIPAAIDHRAVALGMERLQEAYGALCRLGLRRMVVHSGYMPLLYFKEWHHERSVDFWRAYMADKPEDFRLYIENVFEDEPLMMRRLIEELDDSRIQICLDVGHANAMTSADYGILDWIRILGPQIGHLHLHNNDGTDDLHGPLEEGVMDMDAVLDAVGRCCGEEVTMTIESRSCESSARWLDERIRGKAGRPQRGTP